MKPYKPLISCKCTTYGRVDMLEEALHSFLQQTYENKELVIVNDYPLQELKFDHPQVRIYNIKEPFKSIGDKEDFAVDLCHGDIIAVWDDDDIALPHHLDNIHEFFVPGTDLLHWGKGVYYNFGKVEDVCWIGNSGMVYSWEIWDRIGGFHGDNAGYDTTFVTSVQILHGDIVIANPEKPSWFYMWGGRGFHQSGMGTDTPDRPNIIQRHSQHIEQLRREGKIPIGEIELKPQWRRDYAKDLEDFYNAKNPNI